MKKIFNCKNATIADLESNGLLGIATKIYVLSKQLVGEACPENLHNYSDLRKLLEHHIINSIPIVFHNGICFDIPLLEEILEMDLSKLMVIDTLILSQYLNTSRQRHGLDSFFEDYGIEKIEVKDDEWEEPPKDASQEVKQAHQALMDLRCNTDVQINKCLWEDLYERLEYMYTKVKGHVDCGDVDGTRVSPDEVQYIDQYKHSSSVEDYIDRIVTFLCFKQDNARLKEKTRWKADRERIEGGIAELGAELDKVRVELEAVMPQVPEYYPAKSKPKRPTKKDGSLSASGIKWNEYVTQYKDGVRDEFGTRLVDNIEGKPGQIKVLKGYKPPNVNSGDQVKKWLYANGWKPETFDFVKDKEAFEAWVQAGFPKGKRPKDRAVPQITRKDEDGNKELCPSVLKLADRIPEIKIYTNFTTIFHRYGMLKGFLRDMSEDGYLQAQMASITNTMRQCHRQLVNLPGPRAAYAKDIRASLICEEDEIQLGSDLGGLEDNTKQHFMIPHDPEYVESMNTPGFDPHINVGEVAGLITKEEGEYYKSCKKKFDFEKTFPEDYELFKKIDGLRHSAKTTNYSCTYKVGAEKLARELGISKSRAKELIDGYWTLNWAIGAIEDDLVVIKDQFNKDWIINPINGFCYSLRKKNDKFSALNQGTGSYIFDLWIDRILTKMEERFGTKRLQGEFHDEYIVAFKDTPKTRQIMEKITRDSIQEVSEMLYLRKPIGCDVNFGKTYAEIH